MKYLKFLIIGIVFGIILTKSQVISWFRIYEMFRFQSFHMFGIIGSAVGLGIIWILLIKKLKLNSLSGDAIKISPKEASIPRYLLGGIIFGLGWAMTGACPGPMFILVGNGFSVILIAILSGLLGTYVYGLLKNRLPH